MVAANAETLKQNKSPEVLEKIEATKPLLFNMAEQVLATEPDRWNVLIGDDAGGRLPAHFVHDLMKLDGRDMKTFFVANSSLYRVANGPEPYRAYFKYLQEQLGEPLRPLVVTESVSTGSAVDFLKSCMEPYSSQPAEIAAVAVREESLHKVDFAGGVGAKEINDVWHAFESPPAKLSLGRRAVKSVWKHVPNGLQSSIKAKTTQRLMPPTVNETVGIYVDSKRTVPIARRDDIRDGERSTRAYHRMDELASEAYGIVRASRSTTAA